MYIDFHRLSKPPFNLTVDPAFLFMAAQHRTSLAGLIYAITQKKGFMALTGPIGTGKTTLITWLLQKLPPAQIHTALILTPTLGRDDFLELMMLDFGISVPGNSRAQRLWAFQNFLLAARTEGKTVLLIIDEAHKLTPELLEEVRLLGNFETPEEKLLQVLLVGQREFDDTLDSPEHLQLKQRIAVRLSLEPLTAADVELYIRHRWQAAGGALPHPFSPEAVAEVAKWSGGIPRVINAVCDRALMLAFVDDSAKVDADRVYGAARELGYAARAASHEKVTNFPVQPLTLRWAEQYEASHQSLFARWAGKLGSRSK